MHTPKCTRRWEGRLSPTPLRMDVWSMFQNILAHPLQWKGETALGVEGRNFRDSRWECGQAGGTSRALCGERHR